MDAFDKYLINVDLYFREHPQQRLGQVFFNVLYLKHPRVAEVVRGTKNDPFHNDDVIPVFLIQVAELLEG